MSIRETALLDTPEVRLWGFECDGRHKGWSLDEETSGFTLILVRSGSFRRFAGGVDMLVDPLVAYVERPGSVHRVAHPRGGDACVGVGLSEAAMECVASLSVLRREMLIHLDARAGLAQRLLLRRASCGAQKDELVELTMAFAGSVLALSSAEPRTIDPIRPSHRRLAEQAREALRDQPDLKIADLSAILGVSIYHLSHVFRNVTGETLTEFRSAARSLLVMDAISSRPSQLGAVAAEAGFADQAHLSRKVKAETGLTPGALRRLLSPQPADRRPSSRSAAGSPALSVGPTAAAGPVAPHRW